MHNIFITVCYRQYDVILCVLEFYLSPVFDLFGDGRFNPPAVEEKPLTGD